MVLHKVLADAMRLDLVARNATEGASVPRPNRKEMETLSCEQPSQLFEATRSDRFAALWVLLGTTGLRIGKALGLKWADTDLSAHTLVVRRALQRHQDGGLVSAHWWTVARHRDTEVVLSECQVGQTMDRKAMTLRLSQEQAEALEAVTQVDGVPVAEAVRIAINDHIERRRKDKAFQGRLRASLERNRRILEKLADR